MNKTIKIIALSLIILFLTGCTGKYDLKINADLSIDEKLELNIANKDELYKKTLNIFNENNISKDKYNVSISNGNLKIKYQDKYNSIEDYILNSKIYPQLINKINYNKTKEYVDLYVDENLKIKNNDNIINGSNLPDLDVIEVNIENPFKINYTNAESIKDNTYTWTITKDDISKKIQLQFKPTFNKFSYRPVIVGLIMLIVSFILIFNVYKRFKSTQNI